MQTEPDKAIFSDRARWQAWLDVEAALAAVQGEAEIIPDWAARRIEANARLEHLDEGKLRDEIDQTMAPVFALTKVLAEQCGEAGAYVHWGATTQNIVDAGMLLTLREVQARLSQRLGQALTILADLATVHAGTPMVGRTNRQHALPITFGFKIAGWIDELLRVCDQLDEIEPRLFQLSFGGAIGAFQSSGEAGADLSSKLALRLNLRPAQFQGRTQVDPKIEYITRLSLFGLAVSRMASEFYLLMEQELGEVSEALETGVVGSSTMPHKINPKHIVNLSAKANLLRGKAGLALAVTTPSHEGDAVTNRELRLLMQDSCVLALDVAQTLIQFLEVLDINAERMSENLLSSGDLTSMERLMMYLAPRLGRGRAHDILHHVVSVSQREPSKLRSLILSEPALSDVMDSALLETLLDPLANTGQSAAIATELATAAKERARQLLQSDNTFTEAAVSGFAARIS